MTGEDGKHMATLDWSDCPLVEVIPGKVSGAPLLKNTRLPVDAITGNYDAFLDEGLSPEAAVAETLDCYPEAGIEAIRAILQYRAEHLSPLALQDACRRRATRRRRLESEPDDAALNIYCGRL